MPNLEINYVAIATIKPYKNNPRIHDEKHIDQIVLSIKNFDFTNPIIIDESNEILASHGRYLAAIHLKMDTLPCVTLNHLTEKKSI